MFIINKNIDSCDQIIRDLVGDAQINDINCFINSYRRLRSVYNDMDETFKYASKMSDSDFSFFYSVYNFETLNSEDMKKVREDLNKLCLKSVNRSNKLSEYCSDLKSSVEKGEVIDVLRIVNNKINVRENSTYNKLKNTIMDNEIDLIRDYLSDYNYFDLDREAYYDKYGSYVGFTKNSKYLDVRLDNIEMQYELLNASSELDEKALQDLYSIIHSSYYALVNSQENDLTTKNYLSYRKEVKDLSKSLEKYGINDMVDDYLLTTRKAIHKKGFSNKAKVKKIY